MKKFFIQILTILFILQNGLYSEFRRIVSLTPSITEQIYLLGESKKVVGITTFCRKIHKEQQIVGTYTHPNIEVIVSLAPDIVVVSKEGPKKDVVEKILSLGIKVHIFSPPQDYNSLKQQFISLGKLLNKEDFAKKIISYYEKKYKPDKNMFTKNKIIFVLGLEPIFVASEKSYIGEIINFAGGKNCITTEVLYPMLSVEEMINTNSDMIIVTDMGMKEEYIKKFFRSHKIKTPVFVVKSDTFCQPTIPNFWSAVSEVIKNLQIINESEKEGRKRGK